MLKSFWLNFPYGVQTDTETMIVGIGPDFAKQIERYANTVLSGGGTRVISINADDLPKGLDIRFVELPGEEDEEQRDYYEDLLEDGQPHVIGMTQALVSTFPVNDEPTTRIHAVEVTATGFTFKGHSGKDGQYECETEEIKFEKVGIEPRKMYTKDELYAIANALDAPGEGRWRRVLGSFLREAIPSADDVNLRKIVDTWRPTFEGLVP